MAKEQSKATIDTTLLCSFVKSTQASCSSFTQPHITTLTQSYGVPNDQNDAS